MLAGFHLHVTVLGFRNRWFLTLMLQVSSVSISPVFFYLIPNLILVMERFYLLPNLIKRVANYANLGIAILTSLKHDCILMSPNFSFFIWNDSFFRWISYWVMEFKKKKCCLNTYSCKNSWVNYSQVLLYSFATNCHNLLWSFMTICIVFDLTRVFMCVVQTDRSYDLHIKS